MKVDIVPYSQPYPIRYSTSAPVKDDSMFTYIGRGLKWAKENPEIVAAAGLGLFAFGVYLSARKAN